MDAAFRAGAVRPLVMLPGRHDSAMQATTRCSIFCQYQVAYGPLESKLSVSGGHGV